MTVRPTPLSQRLRRAGLALVALCCLGVVGARADGADAALLNPLFQDHAVLQRDHANPVWGHARPGETLAIAIAGHSVQARAGADGRWEATLPPLSAGGPYTLKVAAADGMSQSVGDVMVGDVWLCSGQSNMVLPVKHTLNAWAEIQDAANDRIRMLTVDNAASPVPLDAIPAGDHWLKATPANVPDFSAACYYYARELQRTASVPMGLIVSAWNGSRIEPWLSAQALRRIGGYDEALDLLALYARDRAQAGERWDRQWQAWWRARPGVVAGDEPWNPARTSRDGWLPAPLGKGPWQQWGVPSLADFTGMLWYRITVRLSARQAAQAATLSLGTVNETDQTWVNGRWVGTGYGGERSYALPAGVLHEGDNLVAVNVLGTYRGDGLYGPADRRALRLADGSSVPLGEGWQYRVVPKSYGSPPNLPWQSISGLSTLHNGMIAPLGAYGLRGAVWYQGESNTGDAGHYRVLLEGLRDDLRARFGATLPMLIVQIANYGAPPVHPQESGSAALREVQREVAAEDPHSALAVTIDIGERGDIHPANKQELGRRLARAARRVAYGESLPPSGPVPVSARRDGDAVVLDFGEVTGELVAYGADHPIGFELCGAQPDSCHYASADIRGRQVVLRAPMAPSAIARVRYGWADSPVCTLYDGSGLPVGPFELSLTSTPADQERHP